MWRQFKGGHGYPKHIQENASNLRWQEVGRRQGVEEGVVNHLWYGLTRWNIRQHTSAYVSIRNHTSVYVRIRQHTSQTLGVLCSCCTYFSSSLTDSVAASLAFLRLLPPIVTTLFLAEDGQGDWLYYLCRERTRDGCVYACTLPLPRSSDSKCVQCVCVCVCWEASHLATALGAQSWGLVRAMTWFRVANVLTSTLKLQSLPASTRFCR
jgi:hypothetical protein